MAKMDVYQFQYTLWDLKLSADVPAVKVQNGGNKVRA